MPPVDDDIDCTEEYGDENTPPSWFPGGDLPPDARRMGLTHHVPDGALLDFAGKLDPIYQEAKSGGKNIADHFVANKGRAADALLEITDARAQKKSGTVVKTYEKLRPNAKSQVEAAIPRLGKLVAKYDH